MQSLPVAFSQRQVHLSNCTPIQRCGNEEKENKIDRQEWGGEERQTDRHTPPTSCTLNWQTCIVQHRLGIQVHLCIIQDFYDSFMGLYFGHAPRSWTIYNRMWYIVYSKAAQSSRAKGRGCLYCRKVCVSRKVSALNTNTYNRYTNRHVWIQYDFNLN